MKNRLFNVFFFVTDERTLICYICYKPLKPSLQAAFLCNRWRKIICYNLLQVLQVQKLKNMKYTNKPSIQAILRLLFNFYYYQHEKTHSYNFIHILYFIDIVCRLLIL